MTVTQRSSPDNAMSYCRDVTRRRARNFYYGLKLLPEPQRSALCTVYAWMRRADDLTDDDGDGTEAARARIEAFRAATEEAMHGGDCRDDLILAGLQHVVERFPVEPALFHDALDGQLDDLNGRRYDTFDALREYCYRVASTVGLLCIAIWGYDDRRAPEHAVDRGIAFQLTNILRDFVEDDDRGRVYLPAEDFARHGLSPAALREWRAPDRSRRFLLEQIGRAESYYRKSAPLDGMIEPACRPTLWAMTSIYRRLLEKMRRDPERIVHGPRVRLNRVQKGAIALRARWRARAARS